MWCLIVLRLHRVYWTGFWVYAVLVLPDFLFSSLSVLFDHDNYDYYWDVYVQWYSLNYSFRLLTLGNFGSAIHHLPGCFCPWTFFWNTSLNTLPSDLFMSDLYFQSGYSTGVPGFAIGCPCSVWCCGLINRLMYVFCLVLNHNWFVILL